MKATKILIFLVVFCLSGMTFAMLASAADFVGTFKGTVSMTVNVPAMDSNITSSGNAEITITKKSETKYELKIKTEIAGHPPTEETTEYTKAGSKLTLSDNRVMSGMTMITSCEFLLSGSSGETMTGTLSVVGKIEEDVQTTSSSSFNLTRQ